MKTHSSSRTIGRLVEEEHLLGIGGGAVPRLEVGDDVFDEECADGYDPSQRVQLAPKVKLWLLTGA